MITIDSFSMIFTMDHEYNGYNYERVLIKVTKSNKGQGMIEIVPNGGEYYLYLWYDEGRFPSEFDLVEDSDSSSMRLKIIGVDEI